MQGLPGSGKSQKAEELIASMGNAFRVNKDLLRTMLHFDKFTGRNEGVTQDVSKYVAISLLNAGWNVIIDDTNLNPRTVATWQQVAEDCGAKFEIVKLDVPVEVCVMRDLDREKHVGGNIIKNMALQYEITDRSPYVLCDIDGTIADITHRLQYAKGETKDWKKFFSLISEDTVRKDVAKILIGLYNQGNTIIFVSARPDTYREQTLEWLDKNNLSFAWTLIMRKGNDKREDSIVKKQILDTYFPDKSKIKCVIDDRPRVIKMWREEGLEVIDVGNGVDF